jgi:hypothetical protein
LLIGAIVTFVDLPGDSRLINEVQNTAHTVVFGLLAWLTLSLIRCTQHLQHQRSSIQYLAAFAICLLVGISIEFIQALTGRDADVWDVLRDAAGSSAFLGLYSLRDRKNVSTGAAAYKARPMLLVASMVVLTVALMPLAKVSYAYIGREQAFPLLLDFSSGWYKTFVSTNHAKLTVVTAPREWREASGKLVAEVTLHKAKYPGIEFTDLHPDWSGYSYLVLSIYSTTPRPFPLVIRIHDENHNFALHDRFNRRLAIVPGENRVRIPIEAIRTAPLRREMDMSAIKTVILFSPVPQHPLTFQLSNLRLIH